MDREILDYYNSKGEFIGTEERSIVHEIGLWHKTFHCWIIFRNELGQDYILMQKRSPNKDSAPNKLDSTVAGHYLAGENIEGGIREFREEIGIAIKESELISLGIRITVSDYKENKINKEFQEVYFINKKIPLESLRLQVDEVSGIVELPVDDCIKLFSGKIDHFYAKGLFNDSISTPGLPILEERKITGKDFISFVDQFHYKIMLLAKRALAGENALFI